MNQKRREAQARMQALRSRQAAARQRLEAARQRRGRPSQRPRDPVRWFLGAIIVVLLLLLWRSCQPPEAPEALVCPPCEEETGEGVPAEPPPEEDPLPGGRIPSQPRPAYGAPPPQPLPWLNDLRLQVAGRSPRLADCFVGTDRPGAMKWTALVQPADGRVSDAALEPMLAGEGLSAIQRQCVLDILAEPYALEHDGERATPPKVSIVLEF